MISSTWSPDERVWKGAKHFAHRTAMKRSLAAVSWRVSQDVGNAGRDEWSRGGDIRGDGGGGGSGIEIDPGPFSEVLRLQRFLFLSTDEKSEWNGGDWVPNNDGEDVNGDSDDNGEGPAPKFLWNIPPDPNKECPVGNIREEGLLWGNPKFVGARNPSFVTFGFLGPLSCWTASLFIELSKHFRSLQARHWLRWVLSIGHFPFKSVEALQV